MFKYQTLLMEQSHWPEAIPPDQQPEITVRVTSPEGVRELCFRWNNTVVRKFRVGDGEFDHIEYRGGESLVIVFFDQLHDVGFDLKNMLLENDYSVRIDPILTEEADMRILDRQSHSPQDSD
jgi:hypothetical protein